MLNDAEIGGQVDILFEYEGSGERLISMEAAHILA
jgi:hypothetical protein